MENDLMVPRYKVIADYPHSLFSVGDILIQSPSTYCFKEGVLTTAETTIETDLVTKCPDIFRPLIWSEERAIEDMPMFVKYKKTGNCYKVCPVLGWHAGRDCVYTLNREGKRHSMSWDIGDKIVPATEQEYNDYITSKHTTT